MQTKTKFIAGLALFGLLPAAAMAHTDVSIGIGLGGGYYEPAPVYAAPPPVYYQPAPRYYGPTFVYDRYYGGRGYNGWRDHDRDGWRGHDRDEWRGHGRRDWDDRHDRHDRDEGHHGHH